MASATRLHVGQGTTRGPLTTFPVWTDGPSLGSAVVSGAQAQVDAFDGDCSSRCESRQGAELHLMRAIHGDQRWRIGRRECRFRLNVIRDRYTCRRAFQ